jgi:hypothetical protein
MHANDNYQIQEISSMKEKEMRTHASFASVNLSENLQKIIYFVTDEVLNSVHSSCNCTHKSNIVGYI